MAKINMPAAGKAALDAVLVRVDKVRNPADLSRQFEIALRAITNYVVAMEMTEITKPSSKPSAKTVGVKYPKKVSTYCDEHIATGKEYPHGSNSERRLVAMAYAAGETLKSAAALVGKSEGFVRAACAEFGVSIRHGSAAHAVSKKRGRKGCPNVRVSDAMKRAAIALYKRDYSCPVIAKKLGVGRHIVTNIVRDEGILRNRQEATLARARYDARCNGLMPIAPVR